MDIQSTQWEPISDLSLAADLWVSAQPQFSVGILWNDTFWKPCCYLFLYKIRIQVGWAVG